MLNRTKAIATIQKMLRIQNNCPAHVYTFLFEKDNTQLQQMLNGWQQNQPAMYARHGYYVM